MGIHLVLSSCVGNFFFLSFWYQTSGRFPLCTAFWMQKTKWRVAGRWAGSWLISSPTSWPVDKTWLLSKANRVWCNMFWTENTHWLSNFWSTANFDPLRFKQCCTDPVVRSDPALTEVNYSCSLTEVDLEHLHLRLLPMHNTKTFIAYKHSEYKEVRGSRLRRGGEKGRQQSLCAYLSSLN